MAIKDYLEKLRGRPSADPRDILAVTRMGEEHAAAFMSKFEGDKKLLRLRAAGYVVLPGGYRP